MSIQLAIAGPSGVTPWVLNTYMDGALNRHLNAHLVPLRFLGAGLVENSIAHFSRVVDKKLGLEQTHMVAGQSQGALVALAHTLANQDSVAHVVTVGGPFHGAWLSNYLSFLPAARDMTCGSSFLTDLLDRIPVIADKITNIMTPNERVMDSMSCYLNGIGVTNILVGSESQLRNFLPLHSEVVFDQIIVSQQSVNHLDAMMCPELRSVIWRKVDEVSEAYGFTPDGVPDQHLKRQNFGLRQLLKKA